LFREIHPHRPTLERLAPCPPGSRPACLPYQLDPLCQVRVYRSLTLRTTSPAHTNRAVSGARSAQEFGRPASSCKLARFPTGWSTLPGRLRVRKFASAPPCRA